MGRVAAAVSAIAGLLIVLPNVALSGPASHDPWKLQQVRSGGTLTGSPGQCEACHTLDTSEGENGTSFINEAVPALGMMKIAKGGAFVLSENFGCTFCHSHQTTNTTMDDVLTDFEFESIKHPIGRNVDGVTNSNNEYLSTYGSASLAGELQCLNCHVSSLLTYPLHEGRPSGDPAQWTGTWNKTVNPYALQNVTVAADKDKKHCLDTCHSSAPVGWGEGGGNTDTRPKMGHYEWGNYNAATNTLYDASGQALQAGATASCAVCHDTHTSKKENLLQDGLDRGTAEGTAIVEATCVAVCHAPGAFGTYGHGGKIGINSTTCTPCHDASVSHRDTTDAATSRRLGMVYESTLMSDLTLARNADGLDNDMNGARDDESSFAYSRTSICKTCHLNYGGHGSATRAASCLDCHDVHGDDAAGNLNVAMIRSSVYGEPAYYTAADRTGGVFYKGAGNAAGACDNDACHSNIAGGLQTAHKGGTGAVLAQPCSDCHTMTHADPQVANTDGSFMVSKCTACHFAAADADNWNIADGTASRVSSTEWTTAGHGRASAYPGGNPAASFAGPTADDTGCAYCHDMAVSHGTGTNPFRLANKGTVGTEADRWNEVCLACHRTADAGYDPDGTGTNYANINGTRDVDDNHYGSQHSVLSKGGAFCWDCHDPHGDAQHLMVQQAVTEVSDGAYGAPASTRTVTGLDVTAGGYTSADLANAANTGLCQTCHATSGGAGWYTRNLFTPLASHNGASGTLCTVCHTHPNDFAPESCESCHDSTPYVKGTATAPNVMGTGGTLAGAYGSPYDNAAYGYNVNGHGRDADTAGVSHGDPIGRGCGDCHDLSLPAGAHLDGTLNGRISPDTRNTNSFHLVTGFVSSSTSGDIVQNTFDNYCWTACHSGAGASDMRHLAGGDALPNYAQLGTHGSFLEPANTPPPEMFYEKNLKNLTLATPNYALCVSCHNPHGTNTSSPRADLNNKMVLYRWIDPATLCAQCHL